MNRQEAIKILKAIRVYECYPKSASEETKDAIDMAIESLQRETPKNPVVNLVSDADGTRRLNEGWTEDSLLCPVCHTYFGEVFNEGYCQRCGQKIVQKRVRVVV